MNEALIPGGSPLIHKESLGASRLVQVSRNPFVTTLEARLRCAQMAWPSVPKTLDLRTEQARPAR